MTVPKALILLGGLSSTCICAAQSDSLLLADEHYIMGDPGEDPLPDLNVYERFNPAVGGDSTRLCNGFPCMGWVEDRYGTGQLKHRGYYDQGRLVLFKNYHANGNIEREFKQTDDVKCIERTWHANGHQRSTARYSDGEVVHYQDHYITGSVRYVEERQKHGGCFTRMELYAADGKPISTLMLVDKGKGLLEMSEFHPGGTVKLKGRARCDKRSYETTRIGTWQYFDLQGNKTREEDYIDGKVHAVR